MVEKTVPEFRERIKFPFPWPPVDPVPWYVFRVLEDEHILSIAKLHIDSMVKQLEIQLTMFKELQTLVGKMK